MTKIAGRYEIASKLGEGGMGVVFRAYDPAPMDRVVAVKTLHEFSDPLALELFYKECTALKSISHPNIVEIFDMGEHEEDGHKKPFFETIIQYRNAILAGLVSIHQTGGTHKKPKC